MTDTNKALHGFGTDLFAGMPVKDIDISRVWYEKLMGCPPSFLPNDKEAVWALGEHQWLYIIADPKHAGGSVQTVIGGDLESLIAQISERGLSFDKEETPAEGVRKVMYYDPDGNEIGFGSVPE